MIPVILLHSSKTMVTRPQERTLSPEFLSEAEELMRFLRFRSRSQLEDMMHISAPLAEKTKELLKEWSSDTSQATPALFSFRGDIFSGLQAEQFSKKERAYAAQSLRFLSGLYGILRPDDGIWPYRLEMGYRLPGFSEPSLYRFWGNRLANTIEPGRLIFNLSSKEYDKAILPFLRDQAIITPTFLTLQPKTGTYGFTAVHAKIARGAFAHWLIQHEIQKEADLPAFTELGYRYEPALSLPAQPVFVCDEFQGLGLSVRLT